MDMREWNDVSNGYVFLHIVNRDSWHILRQSETKQKYMIFFPINYFWQYNLEK